jgi:hypothetical protein
MKVMKAEKDLLHEKRPSEHFNHLPGPEVNFRFKQRKSWGGGERCA